VAVHATDNNMAHAHCMLYTGGYKHTLRICNINCFSTATMVTQTRYNITLYIHCLSCWVKMWADVSSCNPIHSLPSDSWVTGDVHFRTRNVCSGCLRNIQGCIRCQPVSSTNVAT